MRRSWLTVGEAAAFLGVSEPALRKWADAGRIPSYRTLGGHRRFRASEIKRCLEQMEHESA